MTTINNSTDLLNAIVNFGADTFIVETEEQAEEVMESIERATVSREITDEDEFSTALEQLDLKKADHIYSFVDGSEFLVCLSEDWDYEEDLCDIADKNGLEVVETTSERSGYPRNLKQVIVGFESFEDAERIAKENGLTLIWIDKRDGWQLWHRGDTAYEPMSIDSSDFGDDYEFENNADDVMDMARDRIADMCNNGESFDDIRSYMDKVEKVTDAIEDLDDDQTVVTYCGEYYDTINLHPIYFSYDTKTTQLAAIKE